MSVPVVLLALQVAAAPVPALSASEQFEGVGSTEMADGLVFDWRGNRLFVTTRSLFARAAAVTRPPLGRPISEAMFTFTVFSDAAYTTFAELPVHHRSSTDLARASVGLVAQDIGPWPPNALVVQVARGDRVYLVGTLLSPKLEQVPSCEAKWNPRAEEVAFDSYRQCVAAVLPTRSSFAAVVRRAQDLVDALQEDRAPHAPPERRPSGRE